jgi:chaperonin cofactor prefoldin
METIKNQIKELENQIYELEKQIFDIENKILGLKYEAQKEIEKWFVTVLDGLETEIDDNEPDSPFYKKNGVVYYKKNGVVFFKAYHYPDETRFYCYHDVVWSVLQNKYKLNYEETQEFLKNMLEKHLELKNVTAWMGER